MLIRATREIGNRSMALPQWRRHVMAALVCVCGCFVAACGGDGGEDRGAAEGGLEKTFERGPVRVVLRIDNPEPTIADRITLDMVVTANEAYEVELPAFGEKLDQFGIADFSSTQPELLDGGELRQSRSYVLEPFLSGEYVIPAMTFRFGKRDDAEAEQHELETEELKVTVSSLLAEDAENLEIHEVAPPVELPRELGSWPWIAGGALAAAGVLALVGFLLRRRGVVVKAVPRRPAHEIAFEQLEQLVAENLPEAGEIKAFYQRISDILRTYIENRFGLRAPERTTEEFLVEVKSSAVLEDGHKSLLGRFLQHCDLVKFAEHQPGIDDIQQTFDACKNFIIETKEDGTTPGTA